MNIWRSIVRPLLLFAIVVVQNVHLFVAKDISTVAQASYTEYIQVIPGTPPAPTLPISAKLHVPFSSQAPYGNWNAPYQEACEEMSLLLVDYYLRGLAITKDIADQEVLLLTKWVEDAGYPKSMTIEQSATIAQQYLGYKTRIIENPTIQNIQYEIAHGNPVIVPTAGRKLPNPYFAGNGPIYHMFVITGYNQTEFITNEVGTTFGQDFVYKKQVLMDAIADWTGNPETIEYGIKKALILEK